MGSAQSLLTCSIANARPGAHALCMANSGQSLQERSPSAGLSISAARFRSKVQSAAVVNKDSAVPEVPPYQIPRHAMHDEIRTYGELQRQIHYALREQHPEWVEPDGDSPVS